MEDSDPKAVKDCLEFKFDFMKHIADMDKPTWDEFYKYVSKQKNFDRIKEFIVERSPERDALEDTLGVGG